MEKKIIAIIIGAFLNLISFGQEESSSEKKHSIYFSQEQYVYNDLMTFYGYQYSIGNHDLGVGLGLGKKRLPFLYIPYNLNYYYYPEAFYYYDNYLKDTTFSFMLHSISFNYAYHFKRENKLHFYPTSNIYLTRYYYKGVFNGEIEPGVNGTDNYKVECLKICFGLGSGVEYDFKENLALKMEFGLSMYFIGISSKSDYFGSYKTSFDLNFNGFARLAVFYRLK